MPDALHSLVTRLLTSLYRCRRWQGSALLQGVLEPGALCDFRSHSASLDCMPWIAATDSRRCATGGGSYRGNRSPELKAVWATYMLQRTLQS